MSTPSGHGKGAWLPAPATAPGKRPTDAALEEKKALLPPKEQRSKQTADEQGSSAMADTIRPMRGIGGRRESTGATGNSGRFSSAGHLSDLSSASNAANHSTTGANGTGTHQTAEDIRQLYPSQVEPVSSSHRLSLLSQPLRAFGSAVAGALSNTSAHAQPAMQSSKPSVSTPLMAPPAPPPLPIAATAAPAPAPTAPKQPLKCAVAGQCKCSAVSDRTIS
jgi:hypothetical protein